MNVFSLSKWEINLDKYILKSNKSFEITFENNYLKLLNCLINIRNFLIRLTTDVNNIDFSYYLYLLGIF